MVSYRREQQQGRNKLDDIVVTLRQRESAYGGDIFTGGC